MKRIVAILIGLSLISCSVEVKDRDGNIMTMEQIKKEGKAIERAINKELEKEDKIETKSGKIVKENVTSTITNSKGVSVRHNGKNYTLDEYVHIKMEWAYFQGQLEAVNDDVRIHELDGCWIWLISPWDGQPLSSVLYNPECVKVKVVVPCKDSTNSYDKVSEEVNFSEESYDPYDTDY